MKIAKFADLDPDMVQVPIKNEALHDKVEAYWILGDFELQKMPNPAKLRVRRRAYARWKAEITLLGLKKNPDKKYCFFMEKIDFEICVSDFFGKYSKILLIFIRGL